MIIKKYICDRCGQELIKRPRRIVFQKYDEGIGSRILDNGDEYSWKNGQYLKDVHYDLCDICYNQFVDWYEKGVI